MIVMNMQKEYIRSRVIKIMQTKLKVNSNLVSGKYDEEALLGNKFGFTPRDLVYLFFEIEKELQVTISQKFILNGNFHTISGVVESVLDSSNIN